MKKYFLLLTIITLCLGLHSCKKEEAEKTPSELIIGTWRITALTSSPAADWDGDGNPETDVFAAIFIEQCVKDDELIFNTNGTVTQNPNILCQGETSADYDDTFDWSIPNATQLVLDDDGDETTYNNFSVSETTISYSASETYQGTSYLLTYTWTKQ